MLKQCVRCERPFRVTSSGVYLKRERCTFHWGKLYKVKTRHNKYNKQYTCCGGSSESVGCTSNPVHVWTGVVSGINGPYGGFVHTRRITDEPKVYALDCEMSFIGRGLALTKVTVIAFDGRLVYQHFVRPIGAIVDYNTRFSGITKSDISKSNKRVKTLAEVQRDLLQIIDANSILIGHGLENDLRVLKIVHKTVVDTSIVFKHSNGFPYRHSLKHLTKTYLKRNIQLDGQSHDSLEDARACLELMLWKVTTDKQEN
ncbi:putative exonuclease GOR [Bactrocera neohumeralis]|uniref:putative exonuclease GOR n=1 Tax=Bactrocera neohumeralis TaxID=98809 RepID=UPI0021665F73|nr:putative exonuclease GOR [Bactrocera neohumeralis]